MKILLAYKVTQRVLDRFYNTIKFQYRLVPEGVKQYQSLIVTDFDTKIVTDLPILRVNCFDGLDYNIAKHTNAILNYAENNQYDWVLNSDADCIFFNSVTQFPKSGFAIVPVHFARENEQPKDTIKKWKNNQLSFMDFWVFLPLIHKIIFSKIKVCERFSGYGYEDLDYIDQCVQQGIYRGSTDIRGIHLYHSLKDRFIDEKCLEKNRNLYLDRKYSR